MIKLFEDFNENGEIHIINEINPYGEPYTYLLKTREDCINFLLYGVYEILSDSEIDYNYFENNINLDSIRDIIDYHNEISAIKFEYNSSGFQDIMLDDWMKERIELAKKSKKYNL